MNKLNLKKVSLALGYWSVVAYILNILFMWLVPPSEFHKEFFALIYPGASWFGVGSFLIALIESFIYGYVAGAIFVWVYNFLDRK